MNHRTTKRFWKNYWNLPQKTRNLADIAFDLLKENPTHPSLQFKKIGKLYSARVDLSYRALAFKDGEDFIWVWIGDHDEYEKLIK